MSDTASSSANSFLFDALTVYLQPLLDKHASNNPVLVYEDLTASWHAVEKFLQSRREEEDGEGDPSSRGAHAAVLKHLTALHRGQVQAYRDAAIVALQEYAAAAELLPLDSSVETPTTRESYVQACCDAVLQGRPGWKVGTGILERNVAATVRHRAGEAYDQLTAKQQQQAQSATEAIENDEEEEGEVGEDADAGQLEEDEDVDEGEGEEGMVEESAAASGKGAIIPATEAPAATTATNQDAKKKGPLAAKRKLSVLKAGKTALSKKVKTLTQPARPPATRQGGRRGRGGISAAGSK